MPAASKAATAEAPTEEAIAAQVAAEQAAAQEEARDAQDEAAYEGDIIVEGDEGGTIDGPWLSEGPCAPAAKALYDKAQGAYVKSAQVDPEAGAACANQGMIRCQMKSPEEGAGAMFCMSTDDLAAAATEQQQGGAAAGGRQKKAGSAP